MSLVLDSQMQNIAFVKEVERHSCIYNCYISEYNEKELTDAAWAEIAKKMNYTVLNCKEKWRNLCTVFTRREKLRAKKWSRPYYLTPHLKFLLPFIKLRSGETLPEQIEETETKKRKVSEYKKNIDDPKYFLMSLLPDLRQMNNRQTRAFKKGVLELVDIILEEEA